MAATANKKRTQETRRTPRRVFERFIGVLWHGHYIVVRAQQLSEGGLIFVTDQVLSARTQTVVSMILPGGESIVARGEIVLARKKSGALVYTVRFAPLPLHMRRMIRNYVSGKTQAEAEREVDDPDSGLDS